jgi:hypothetical protein
MKGSFTRLLCLLLLTVSSSFLALGQGGTTGSLSGTVTDPKGAVVAGATVVVKNEATGNEYTTQTSNEGVFRVPSLNSGTYTATITATGFKQSKVTEIKINVGEASSVNVELEVGAANETVTIVGGGELLKTENANVGTTLVGRQITDIPTASRDALDLVLTMPGTATPGRPRTSTVNGLPKGSLNISIDGVNVQDNVLKSSDGYFTYIRPRTDAVDEVTVSTSNPGAESSGEGAVQIKFVTKAGTNEYHGGLYWYHRNTSLNSNYWFNNATLNPDPVDMTAPRTRNLLNQPGGKVGGPIRIPKLFDGRDKAFFFVNYEEFRLPEAASRTRTFFTPEAQSGLFRYVATTPAAGVPAPSATTTCTAVTATTMRCALNLLTFGNGVAGFVNTPDPTVTSLLNAIRGSLSQASLTPSTNATLGPNYVSAAFINRGFQLRRFPTVRFDFEVNKKNHVENIWNFQDFGGLADFLNGVDPAYPGFPNFGTQASKRFSNVTAWRTTIKSNLINEARFGLTGGTVLFFANVNSGQFQNQGGYSLGISAAGVSNATVVTGPSRRNAPVKQFTDTLTWVKGNHSFNFGGSYSRIGFWGQSLGPVVQTIGFGIRTDDPLFRPLFDNTNPVVCCGATSFFPGGASVVGTAAGIYATLTGRLTSVGGNYYRDENSGAYTYNTSLIQRAQQQEIGFFGQDTWRFRPNLTLTYGLRWEIQQSPVAKNGNFSRNTIDDVYGISGVGNIFRPGTVSGQLPLYRQLAIDEKGYDTDYSAFAPSLGFSYSPNFSEGFMNKLLGNSGQTVFRGGLSMAYVREGINNYLSIFGSNPGGVQTGNRTPDLGNLPIGTLLRTGPFAPPTAPGQLTFPFAPNLAAGQSVNGFDPNLKTGYVASFTFGVQREITKDTVFEARYVGNRGHNLWRQYNLNETDVLSNGFVNEFRLAQQNLLSNIACATTAGCTGGGLHFRYRGAGTGTSPLPILLSHFRNASAGALNPADPAQYTSSFFAFSTFVNALNPLAPNIYGIANNLASRTLYANPSFPFRPNMLSNNLASNFWVVNPNANGAFIIDNGTQTWYDSLQLELRRRLSKGLLVQANYVFSKSLTNFFASSSVAFSQFRSLHQPSIDKTNSPFDITHAFKTNFIYELPIGKGQALFGGANGLLDKFIGGWGLNGSIRVQSGTPFDLGNVQLVGMTRHELQRLLKVRKDATDPVTGVKTRGLVYYFPDDIIVNTRRAFNFGFTNNQPTYTFGAPTGRFIAPANFGNCIENFPGAQCSQGHVILTGPRFVRADMSIVKKIRFTERVNFEMRGEFLNAFNNINFKIGSPASDTVTLGGFNGTGFAAITTAYQDNSTTNDPGGRLVQIVLRLNF